MNTRLLPRRTALGAALSLLLAAAPAGAACTYTTLTSDVTSTPATSPAYYSFSQLTAYWTAVAVRPQSGDDWDMYVYGGTAAEPTCVSGLLASSTEGIGALDFVVGDFNHDPPGTYYAAAYRYSGTQGASVQWDDGSDLIAVNGTAVGGTLSPSDVIRVYDIYLDAGTTYTFDFYPQSGQGGRLLLFRNTAGGAYWAGRSSAQFEVAGRAVYNAPASGYYGVVVVNDLGLSFSYWLGVTASACGLATTLTAGTPMNIASPSGHLAFDVESGFWMGFAVRPVSGDWDTQLYSQPSGGTAPTCFANLLATSSRSGGVVDITVGDFNHSPLGWHFAYPYMFSGGATADVEFTGTQGILHVNDFDVTGTLAAGTLGVMYDVRLEAGRTYEIDFAETGSGLTMLLFANPGGGAYYTGRSGAVVSAMSSSQPSYTAPVSGWYGIAILNDGNVTKDYAIGVGDCSQITPLVAGTVTWTGSAANAYFSFDQTVPFWTAVAVRNTSVDWQLSVDQDETGWLWPGCAGVGLAVSTAAPPRQDVIVGDFNYNASGRYYMHAEQYTPASTNAAQVEWDSGTDAITVNDNNLTTRATGPNDIVGCWDVYLNGGQAYQFTLSHGGGADLKLLLFRNWTGGTFWVGRISADFEVTGTRTYTPPSSGYYGVVVINDNGATDSYSVSVKTCNPILTLVPAPSFYDTYDPAPLVEFVQTSPYWTPIAVRADNPLEDRDLAVYSLPSGGAPGVCASGPLASSTYVPGITDYVIGNFNVNPYGSYYALGYRFAGSSSGTLQYFPGHQLLPVGGPMQARIVDAHFLVESWDSYLIAGQTYTVNFAHDSGLNAKVDVMAPTGGVYWTGRFAALVEGSHSVSFSAPVTGFYGIVVVNDGGAGQFVITLTSGSVSVAGSPRPDRDVLSSISPNPGHGGMRFDYALHADADVAFDIIDMAGRVVSRFRAGVKGAGTCSDIWSATDAGGRPLPAGMYFVRMRAGERMVGTRKVTLLE